MNYNRFRIIVLMLVLAAAPLLAQEKANEQGPRPLSIGLYGGIHSDNCYSRQGMGGAIVRWGCKSPTAGDHSIAIGYREYIRFWDDDQYGMGYIDFAYLHHWCFWQSRHWKAEVGFGGALSPIVNLNVPDDVDLTERDKTPQSYTFEYAGLMNVSLLWNVTPRLVLSLSAQSAIFLPDFTGGEVSSGGHYTPPSPTKKSDDNFLQGFLLSRSDQFLDMRLLMGVSWKLR